MMKKTKGEFVWVEIFMQYIPKSLLSQEFFHENVLDFKQNIQQIIALNS